MSISIIVAVDKKLGIGRDGNLLCHIKEDLQYFKKITNDSVVIMGRLTYESLPNGALSNRVNIVLTRREIDDSDAIVANSVEDAISKARDFEKDIFIIGGGSIYEQFMPVCDKLYVTYILEEFDADTYFPSIDSLWEVESFDLREDLECGIPCLFSVYRRGE